MINPQIFSHLQVAQWIKGNLLKLKAIYLYSSHLILIKILLLEYKIYQLQKRMILIKRLEEICYNLMKVNSILDLKLP